MANATLKISLSNLQSNYRALSALSNDGVETAAVVKANAYGLGIEKIAQSFLVAGAKSFFVATPKEARELCKYLPNTAHIYVFSGLLPQDLDDYQASRFIPLLNSLEQIKTYLNAPIQTGFGLQLDTGMNRLGIEEHELKEALALLREQQPELVISHLACADEPEHPQNKEQLATFKRMTDGMGWRRSLAATGGVLLGKDYHFNLTRPGIGLYGAAPFKEGLPTVELSIPIIQTREVKKGESVGYGASWRAKRDSIIATLSAGYADGILRAVGTGALNFYANHQLCPLVGRVSMDLITVDITNLDIAPTELTFINNYQTVDDLANAAGTIGYEILTSLGARYTRHYEV